VCHPWNVVNIQTFLLRLLIVRLDISAKFHNRVLVRLRGGGNRGKGACARRRHRKTNTIQKEEGNSTSFRDIDSANGTTGINGSAIPAYHFEPQEEDGAFSALDRLLDNPVIASFAEKLFSDAKFQA
jgi:hypothetical protein